MHDFVITDREIDEVEQQLGLAFDAEARLVISCLDTADIQACPGGGKTSSLIAKLLIMERQLPMSGSSGICVLTHTNVAIEEIRQRTSSKSKLFLDPNYCGTIQSFVDRFLAIPAYCHYFGKRPAYIDGDIFNRRMDREYVHRYQARHKFLFPPTARKSRDDEMGHWRGLRFAERGGTTIYTQGLGGIAFSVNPMTERYEIIHSAKQLVLRDGILHFDDAYYLAQRYLSDFPALRRLVRLRFRYVFIDEMQDTASHQIAILDDLFGDEVVVQRFGDQNQRIYDATAGQSGWVPNRGNLALSNSKRLSNTIAASVRHVCHAPHAKLNGHDRSAIPPKILLFSDEHIGKVLPTFAELIASNGLPGAGRIFKAVGRVGQLKTDPHIHTLSSYLPGFRKEPVAVEHHPTLSGYLYRRNTGDVNDYREAVLRAFLHILFIEAKRRGISYLSKSQLLKCLATKHPQYYRELNYLLVCWCRELHLGKDCLAAVREHLNERFLPLFQVDMQQLDPDITAFIGGEANAHQPVLPSGIYQEGNAFIYPQSDGFPDVTIFVDTVHGVKGETHTATLYLETFYTEYDIWCILDSIKGPITKRAPRHQQFLPIAYVAMTRPTDLLCLALHKETTKHKISQIDLDGLAKAGWEIIDVDKAEIAG